MELISKHQLRSGLDFVEWRNIDPEEFRTARSEPLAFTYKHLALLGKKQAPMRAWEGQLKESSALRLIHGLAL